MEFRQLKPTPARGVLKPQYYTDPGWHAEQKFDGDRRISQFIGGKVRFTGRRISEVDGLYVEKTANLPHLNTYAPEGLNGTVLDGEVVATWPRARSKDVTSIMGSKPDLAIKKQMERGWLGYRVFDCLFWQGNDIRGAQLWQRRAYAERALSIWGNTHATLAEAVTKDRETFLINIWGFGGEGIILKRLDSNYDDHTAWVKVKREDTVDVVIMGYDPPAVESTKVDGTVSETRLHANGWIGAVRFGQYFNGVLVDCGCCSGMDDATRAEFSRNGDKYIGEAMEILANEREPTGKFRHPRFIRLRPDKTPTDCILERKYHE